MLVDESNEGIIMKVLENIYVWQISRVLEKKIWSCDQDPVNKLSPKSF